MQVSDASQIGAKLRIAVKLVHCSHLANGIWMGQNLITTSVDALIWSIIWFKTDLWWHKVHLICFTIVWSTFKEREVLGASDGHPLRWNWKGCKYFGEVQIKRNWTSPDGVGCHQGGGRPKVGSNPPLSQLGFSKVCQGEDRRFGAGCQPSSYSTAFHLLGKQFYNICQNQSDICIIWSTLWILVMQLAFLKHEFVLNISIEMTNPKIDAKNDFVTSADRSLYARWRSLHRPFCSPGGYIDWCCPYVHPVPSLSLAAYLSLVFCWRLFGGWRGTLRGWDLGAMEPNIFHFSLWDVFTRNITFQAHGQISSILSLHMD